MTMPHYLTKSRFKVGSDCARKLNYMDDPAYGNLSEGDDFLKALAEGGFQVGELAKLYFPGGIDLKDVRDHDEAVRLTNEALVGKSATIYEAAFRWKNTFIRVDVLVKKNSKLHLYEVKAGSFNSEEGLQVFKSAPLEKGEYELHGDWSAYVLDLAFQTFVCEKAGHKVVPYLMLTDKAKRASVDGLHQLFLITRDDNGRSRIAVREGVGAAEIGEPVLSSIGLGEEIRHVLDDVVFDGYEHFESMVSELSEIAAENRRAAAAPGWKCKSCEFRTEPEKDLKSGYQECWKEKRHLKDSDFERAFVYDIWNFGAGKKLMDNDSVIFASDVERTDLTGGKKEKANDKAGHSRIDRQEFQIETEGLGRQLRGDISQLAGELSNVEYPLHFIDFETAMVAIPFFAGHKPYSQLAYQFSHHVVHKDGRLEHRDAYLDSRVGHFPNFDFVRALKKSLSGDNGTILRFAAHENTVLNQIRGQLSDSMEPDREQLIQWIESITTPPGKNKDAWVPKRQFIDMLELYKRHTYLSDARGSNSIKKVLPAVLNYAGQELGEKFGTKFGDWIQFEADGSAKDPYKLLPPTWGNDISNEAMEKFQERIIRDESLNQGGAALVAWARMQYTEMSTEERDLLSKALLRYCQLDTLAMVIIWEWWQLEIKKA